MSGSARQVLVKVHRYVGLALAPFIIIIAATGSIITFYDELERAVNSQLRVVEPQKTAWTLSLTETDSPATAATVAIDARDGRLLGVQIPTGHRAANTFTSWIMALHVTAVFGRPWQIAVSLFGILVVAITVSGVFIWRRKRRGSRQRVRDGRGATFLETKALATELPA